VDHDGGEKQRGIIDVIMLNNVTVAASR